MTAYQIVDILLEADFSPEDMEDFVDHSLFTFNWEFVRPSNDPEDAKQGFGQHVLHFKLLVKDIAGTVDIIIIPDSHASRATTNYTVRIDEIAHGPVHYRSMSVRWRSCEINWPGVPQVKEKVEGWVRERLSTVDWVHASKGRLVAATNSLTKLLQWKPTQPLATPEEVAQIKLRFDYGNDKCDSYYHKSEMFEDPRVEGRETDYDHLTSEDIRFWNALADEYDAKNQRS